METSIWPGQPSEPTGVCRFCGALYTESPSGDSTFEDDEFLEAEQVAATSPPVVLALHLELRQLALGEWCSLHCFHRDLALLVAGKGHAVPQARVNVVAGNAPGTQG